MKLEMAESLVFSWLRHEKHCQVVQMNWKTSEKWKAFVNDKELNSIYKKARRLYDFVSKNVKDADQLIKKGEVDVIGIELDIENPLHVKNIHAVDVAFHEKGLNYKGGKKETESRIMKKYIRTALSIYKFFGSKTADIYFVTPYVTKHRDSYAKIKNLVSEFFVEKGFNFSFHFYSNEDFYTSIFIPIECTSKNLTDTSELFARSLKLVRLMSEYEKDATVIDSENKISNLSKKKENLCEEKKIGAKVREYFYYLSSKNLLSEEMLNNLQSPEYSKNTFRLCHPVLVTKDKYNDQRKKYYKTPYLCNDNEYFLCNDWYERSKDKLTKWYNQIIKKK